MPFRSESQRKKFHALQSEGKISKETVQKWEKETPSGPLPERSTWKEIPSIKVGPKVRVRRAIKTPRYK